MLSRLLEVGIPALCGGAGLGVATSAHLLLSGRITGFSGIIASTLQTTHTPRTQTRSAWQPAFLSAFFGTGAALQAFAPQLIHLGHGWSSAVSGPTTAALTIAVLSGGLVGYGSRLGSGCTSGHGVCGLPRLSRRSFIAVGTWFATAPFAAMLSARVYGHPQAQTVLLSIPDLSSYALPGVVALSAALGVYATSIYRRNRQLALSSSSGNSGGSGGCGVVFGGDSGGSLAVACGVGSLMSASLLVSGMVDPDYVQAFLDPLLHAWNPAMGAVFAGALGVNFPAFWSILSRPRPVLLPSFNMPTKSAVDRDLIMGAVLFGAGWGLGGICPGPGMLALLTGNPLTLVWLLSLLSAMQLHAKQSAK